MEIAVHGHHLIVTKELHDYAVKRFEGVSRLIGDRITAVSVTLSVDKLVRSAQVTVRVPGQDLFAEAHHEDLYAAIDLVMDKLRQQALKRKGKQLEEHHQPAKHQETPVDSVSG